MLPPPPPSPSASSSKLSDYSSFSYLLSKNVLTLSISVCYRQINSIPMVQFNIDLCSSHALPAGEISTAEFVQFTAPLLLSPMSHYFTSFPLSTLTLILYNRANSSHALPEVVQIDPRLDFTSRLSHLYISPSLYCIWRPPVRIAGRG